ncbi:hypothetical protein ABGB17_00970 [Sphaerisporangium sp. B11E5]|uniref:hypothetical protein n=1 Tax=Sphaerisporangium sp. B11E5 TaxID=3153563 RepID=UPI00325E8BD1
MIAREYGYPVLPGAALGTPGVEEVLRRRERAGRRWAFPALGALGLPAVLLSSRGGPAAAFGVVAGVAFLVVLGLFLLWRRARRRERSVLATYGWQVWPYRGEKVTVVSGHRPGGRRWSHAGRVVLLAPDGQSHCSFPPPGGDWDGPRPGRKAGGTGRAVEDLPRGARGEVWFAGDTRFGGVLAVPGGLPFRYVTRDKPGTRRGDPEEDELARRAGLLRTRP